MDGPSFRHLVPKPWKPELRYLDLKLNLSAGARLIAANDALFAVPWASAGGNLGLIKLDKPGKNPQVRTVKAHSAPVSAFDFSPLRDNLLATGSRDSVVKVWNVEGDSNLDKPLASLTTDSKRITCLNFHPNASNILLTGGGEGKVTVWDVEKNTAAYNLGGMTDALLSANWNYRSLLLTSCKDNHVRLFDVRANAAAQMDVTPHEGTKGVDALWLGSVDRSPQAGMPVQNTFMTLGFSKGTDREIATWDIRQLGQRLTLEKVDISSSAFVPYYDPGNGVLYLTEKGNRIYVYEVLSSGILTQVSKLQLPASFSGAFLLHRRQLNSANAEIARFLLVNAETADTLSVEVPRKDTTVWREDLYFCVPSGEPVFSAAAFCSGENIPPRIVDMRPSGMTSIYDLSETEGGRSKARDISKTAAVSSHTAGSSSSAGSSGGASSSGSSGTPLPSTIKEGPFQYAHTGMIFTSWVQAVGRIKKHSFCIFESTDSASVYRSIDYTNITEFKPVELEPSELIIHSAAPSQTTTHLRFKSEAERDLWIRCITEAQHRWLEFQKRNADSSSSSEAVTPSSSRGGANSPAVSIISKEGYLNKYSEGYFYNAFQKTFFRVSTTDCVLRAYASDSNMEVKEELHMEKASSVYVGTSIPGSVNYFNLVTPTRVWVLQASSEEEMNEWIELLKQVLKIAKKTEGIADGGDGDGGPQSSNELPAIEGYMSTKSGMWSMWARVWVRVAGGEILMFPRNTSLQPTGRISLGQTSSIDLSQYGDPQLEFEVKVSSNPPRTHQFYCSTIEERDEWLWSLRELRVEAVSATDISPSLGLVKETIEKELVKDIESSLTNIIDPTELKNGNGSPILICIFGGQGIVISSGPAPDQNAQPGQNAQSASSSSFKSHLVSAFVVPLSANSLAVDAVFILDTGSVLFQWQGKKSTRLHKAKALDLTTRIRTKERNNLCQIVTITQGVEAEEKAANTANFWKVLGVANSFSTTRTLASTLYTLFTPQNSSWKALLSWSAWTGSGNNAASLSASPFTVKLYRVLNWAVCCVHQGRLPSKDKLHSKYVYVLESGCEIQLWTGKSSSKESKKCGLKLVQLLQEQKVAQKLYYVIYKTVEGAETSIWKEKFSDYPSTLPISMQKPIMVSNITSRREQPVIDTGAMHKDVDTHSMMAATQYANGGKVVNVWKVEEFEKYVMPKSEFGHFYSANSFLILYSYKEGNADKLILYFWQGRDSSIQEKGTSAYLTKELDDTLSGTARQVRVVQNQEPAHFLNVFKGQYVVHLGEYRGTLMQNTKSAISVQNTSSSATPAPLPTSDDLRAGVHYYDIRGKNEATVHAREVTGTDAVLNANHAFLAIDYAQKKAIAWIGSRANEVEIAYAKNFLPNIMQIDAFNAVAVSEKRNKGESADVLAVASSLLGFLERRLHQVNDGAKDHELKQRHPRLFVFSAATGIVAYERLALCDQDSLDKRYVMVLDAIDKVWIWFGPLSKVNEQKLAMQAAVDYASKAATLREVPVYGASHASVAITPTVWVTKPGMEPLHFTSQFHGWSSSKTEVTAAKNSKAAGSSSPAPSPGVYEVPVDSVLKDYLREVYTYAELLGELPLGVDSRKLETYLTRAEFEAIFKMTKEEYDKLPTWKQENSKKAVGLF